MNENPGGGTAPAADAHARNPHHGYEQFQRRKIDVAIGLKSM